MTASTKERQEARDKPLRDFLLEVHARCMWQQPVKHVGTMSAYVAGARLFMTMVYERTEGWDVYIPADTSGKIDATLDALRTYITEKP